MSKFRYALVAVVVMALALTATLVSPTTKAEAASEAWKNWWPTPGGKFNTPRSSKANETRLERQVIDAINHARYKSTIKMVMFSYDRHQITDALIRARKYRKVSVQVIINNHELTPAARRLKNNLGTNRNYRNWFLQCVSSCRGQGDVQHSKFILFSATGAAKNTVMLGSLNMKWNGIHNQFNDLLTMNGRTSLYNTLYKVFWEMRRDRLARPSYIRKDFGDHRLYVLPFPRGSAATSATRYTGWRDPMSEILRDVKCTGAKTASGRTIIRVSMHAWDGERGAMIARNFRNLYAAGCDVKIEVGFIGRKIREIFATKTKRGYPRVRSSGYDTPYGGYGEIDKYSHMKLLLINGNYAGKPNRKVIVTGSANHQNGGQYGDEIIFRLYHAGVYDQYLRNWNRIWANYTHGFNRVNARMTINGRVTSVPTLTDQFGVQMPDWRDE